MSATETYAMIAVGLVLMGAWYWLGFVLGVLHEQERRMKEFDGIYGWRRWR
jgi:hypothetical protein